MLLHKSIGFCSFTQQELNLCNLLMTDGFVYFTKHPKDFLILLAPLLLRYSGLTALTLCLWPRISS